MTPKEEKVILELITPVYDKFVTNKSWGQVTFQIHFTNGKPAQFYVNQQEVYQVNVKINNYLQKKLDKVPQ